MRKQFLFIASLLALALVFTGCSAETSKPTVSIDDAAKNFNNIISNNTENIVYHDQYKHFGIKLADGDKFEWTEDTSVSSADFSLSLNADSFIKAGLNINQLVGTTFSFLDAKDGDPNMLVYTHDVGNISQSFSGQEDAFRNLIGQIPLQLNALNEDGYILDLEQGFQVHWNGAQRENKDIAIIINADELIQAGLDVDKLDSWKIMKNEDTNDKQVRLLKIYYLK